MYTDDPVSVGDYKFTADPSEPMLLHLWAMPIPGTKGMNARDQAQAGRQTLTTISFEDMERELRDLLNRALKDGGFDAARDIERSPSSVGHAARSTIDRGRLGRRPLLPIEARRRKELGHRHRQFGLSATFAHSAIDQAGRAVNELVGGSELHDIPEKDPALGRTISELAAQAMADFPLAGKSAWRAGANGGRRVNQMAPISVDPQAATSGVAARLKASSPASR